MARSHKILSARENHPGEYAVEIEWPSGVTTTEQVSWCLYRLIREHSLETHEKEYKAVMKRLYIGLSVILVLAFFNWLIF